MLGVTRRIFRSVLPRRPHPVLDAPVRDLAQDSEFAAAYSAGLRETKAGDADDPFVVARYAEGKRWRSVLSRYLKKGRTVRVLDIGGGNGAIELALAAEADWSVFSIDAMWNAMIPALLRRTGKLRRIIADADRLPFRDTVFDAVTCLETVEHLLDPKAAATEIARVSKTSGLLLVTTPPDGVSRSAEIHTLEFAAWFYCRRFFNAQSPLAKDSLNHTIT